MFRCMLLSSYCEVFDVSPLYAIYILFHFPPFLGIMLGDIGSEQQLPDRALVSNGAAWPIGMYRPKGHRFDLHEKTAGDQWAKP